MRFEPTSPTTVRVSRNVPSGATDGNDVDPITNTSTTGCTEVTPGQVYDCTGVARLVGDGAGGDDSLDAGFTTFPLTLDGGLGNDFLVGGDGVATLRGGPGDDFLFAQAGNDVIDGGEGQDFVSGSDGNDRLVGGGGDDDLLPGAGSDDYSGGTGADRILLGEFTSTSPNARVTLDDQANDSLSDDTGEVDNVRADIETVEERFSSDPSGDDTITGNAGSNTLGGGTGNDTIDGLAGNDVLNGGNGDDTIRARDGFADRVSCGPGTDTAEVDTLDRVEECENVERAEVANPGSVAEIPEDRAPTVAFTFPASGALLPTRAPTVLTATATDDRGIANVLFVDDERIVCTDAVAPYTCTYQARGEDVGRNTLAVIAVDTAQQTASALRAVNVDRFAPAGITGTVAPARDLRAPYRFRTAGRLRLPPGVTSALGCEDGQMSIQIKAGAKTISTRRATLSRSCAFTSTVTFRDRRRFTRNGRLRFTIRFTGNEVLTRSAAVVRSVRTR